jgi:hypothetical protein
MHKMQEDFKRELDILTRQTLDSQPQNPDPEL